jgi:hypothetical protein
MFSLKTVLQINSVSSGAVALLLIAFSGFISQWFGVSESAPFIGVGIFLLLFAVYVFYQSRKEPLHSKGIQTIIITDSLWVTVSALLILFQLFELSMIGYLFIGGVALWVALMAVLQSKGLKRINHNQKKI